MKRTTRFRIREYTLAALGFALLIETGGWQFATAFFLIYLAQIWRAKRLTS